MKQIDKPLESSDSLVIAEYRLLNAVALNPDNLYKNGASKELFTHEVCKSIYESVEALSKQNIPITAQALYQQASGIDLNVNLESIDMIMNLQSDPNVETKDMVQMLAQVKRSREAFQKFSDIRGLIDSNPVRSDEINEKIKDELYKAEELLLYKDEYKKVQNFDELTDDYKQIFEERKNGKQYHFGDPILDKVVTYGPAPGCGGLIAAATGMGKSAFCLNLINRFINQQIPCMYYSLEMGKADTMDRLISLRTNIPLKSIINPEDIDTWEAVKNKINEESEVLKENKKFRFSENASVGLNDVRQDIIKFQTDIGQKYCIVVFDLLSMIKEFSNISNNGLNFAQAIEIAINKLNALAKELDFHYIAVLQMNRSTESGHIDDLKDIDAFKPTRNSIKNANAFLERVRYALSLFRPRYYAEEYLEKELWEELQDICYVNLLKQNQGKVGGNFKYLFDPDCMSMTPLVDEIQSDEEED